MPRLSTGWPLGSPFSATVQQFQLLPRRISTARLRTLLIVVALGPLVRLIWLAASYLFTQSTKRFRSFCG
jgi:hypothetical protein